MNHLFRVLLFKSLLLIFAGNSLGQVHEVWITQLTVIDDETYFQGGVEYWGDDIFIEDLKVSIEIKNQFPANNYISLEATNDRWGYDAFLGVDTWQPGIVGGSTTASEPCAQHIVSIPYNNGFVNFQNDWNDTIRFNVDAYAPDATSTSQTLFQTESVELFEPFPSINVGMFSMGTKARGVILGTTLYRFHHRIQYSNKGAGGAKFITFDLYNPTTLQWDPVDSYSVPDYSSGIRTFEIIADNAIYSSPFPGLFHGRIQVIDMQGNVESTENVWLGSPSGGGGVN